MKTTQNIATLAAALLALAACEKEIDVDYRLAPPKPVAEVSLSATSASAKISQTRAMDDNSRANSAIEGATVVIYSGDSIRDTLRHTRNGTYYSTLRGIPGTEYTVDVNIDGNHYTSTSTMQKRPTMNSFRFVWKKMLTERMLFADLKLQDTPGEASYYFMHLYRNGLGYRWAVMRDTSNPNDELQQLFGCFTKRQMDNDTNGTDADVLRDGDVVRIEIRAIDRRAYDYLFSMQQMDNTGTNPIQNFTGGCLGYFSAYSAITMERTFSLADVEEE